METANPRDAWDMSDSYRPPFSKGPKVWSWLVPGRYRLSVHSRAQDEPLFVLDDLDVRPGAEPAPRLESLDLRERIKAVTVSVVASGWSPGRGRRWLGGGDPWGGGCRRSVVSDAICSRP